VPAVTPGLRWRVRANRAFLARATRFLAGEARIGQFLDLGTGIPGTGNTHEVAPAISAYGPVGRKLRDQAFGDSKDAPISGGGN